MKVKNNSKRLYLVGGVNIAPGETKDVDAKCKDSIKELIDSKELELVAEAPEHDDSADAEVEATARRKPK